MSAGAEMSLVRNVDQFHTVWSYIIFVFEVPISFSRYLALSGS